LSVSIKHFESTREQASEKKYKNIDRIGCISYKVATQEGIGLITVKLNRSLNQLKEPRPL
jgi:hypothetical protein